MRPRIDVPGTLTASAGLFALVYGFSNAETHGWGAPLTIVALAAGVALLAAFIAIERRVEHPLLPLRVVADRGRGGAYLAVAIVGAGMFGVFLFLTYYMQQTLGFSPLKTGLAFLPMMAVIMPTGAIGQTRLVPRFGARRLVTLGMVFGAIAMLILTGVTVDSELRDARAAGPDGHGPRPRPGHGARDEHRDARRRPPRRRRRLRDGQHRPADRRLDRHGAAEHAGRRARRSSYAAPHRPAADLAAQAAVHGYTTAFTWSAGIFVDRRPGLMAAAAERRAGSSSRTHRPSWSSRTEARHDWLAVAPAASQRERAWTTLMITMQIQATIVANVAPSSPSACEAAATSTPRPIEPRAMTTVTASRIEVVRRRRCSRRSASESSTASS